MYTDLTAAVMKAAWEACVVRVRRSVRGDGRPLRAACSVCVPKTGPLRGHGRVGPVYDKEMFRAVSFADIGDVCAHVNAHVYVRVGAELRHYTRGAPMGEPSSCAQANAVAMNAEQNYLTQRERDHEDGSRVRTLGFVDDMHFRFAYDTQGRIWTKESAQEMSRTAETLYPAPLTLE